jgi:hypothetical protein
MTTSYRANLPTTGHESRRLHTLVILNIIIFVCIILLQSEASLAQDPTDKASSIDKTAFALEFHSKLRSLAAASKDVKIEGTLIENTTPSPSQKDATHASLPPIHIIRHVVVEVLGDQQKLHFSHGENEEYLERIIVSNKEDDTQTGFVLRKRTPTGELYLEHDNIPRSYKRFLGQQKIVLGNYTYYVGSINLLKAHDSSQFHIKYIHLIEKNSELFYRVDFSLTEGVSPLFKYNGFFHLDINRNWSVRDYDVTLDITTKDNRQIHETRSGTVEYPDGNALTPSKLYSTTKTLDGPTRQLAFEPKRWTKSGGSPSAFLLSSYGLSLPGQEVHTSSVLWIIVISFVCLISGFLLKRRYG